MSWVPRYLARPAGLILAAAGIVAGITVWSMPEGLTWLPALYFLKLVAGHAVPPDEATAGQP